MVAVVSDDEEKLLEEARMPLDSLLLAQYVADSSQGDTAVEEGPAGKGTLLLLRSFIRVS